MAKVRPAHAIFGVLFFAALVVVADYALDGGFRQGGFQRVAPDKDGRVVLPVSDLKPGDAKFYRFLNYGNQEVKFFVARDIDGRIHTAFDANEICYKTKRGYTHQGEWMVCNKCDKAFRVTGVQDGGGGCKPVPFDHRLQGDNLILEERDILTGWRYFR
ncbi:MAG: Fe-S-containing protein [Acidobacteriota bacterium]